MLLKNLKYAKVIYFLLLSYLIINIYAKDFRQLDQYSDSDALFRSSCHINDYTKFIDKYAIDVSKGLYDSSLWNFTTSSGYITNYIQQQENIYLINYAKQELIPYFVLTVFAFITLVSLIVFCCCCCSPYLCCKKQQNDREMFKKLAFKLVVVFSILAIVISSIGIWFSLVFASSYDAFTCSFMAAYFNLRNGNQGSTVKWYGVSNISPILDSISSQLNAIKNNYQNTFSQYEQIFQESGSIEAQLSQFYSDFNGYNLDNYFPPSIPYTGNGVIIPEYIKDLGNYTDNNTYLNTIYQEYMNKIQSNMYNVTKMKDASKGINDDLSQINSIIGTLEGKLSDINTNLDLVSDRFVKAWMDLKDNVKNDIYYFLLLIFGFIIIVQIINLLSIFSYKNYYKYQWMRFFNHFVWFALTILTIFTFLIAAIMGCIGLFSKDWIPVMNFLLSEQNLLYSNYIIDNKLTAQTLSICLNHGGEIAIELLGLQNTQVDYVNDVYIYRNNLLPLVNMNQTSINQFANSQAVNNFTSTLQKMSADMTLITANTNDANSPIFLLNELNKWSDNGASVTYQSSCETKVNDQWVTLKGNCRIGYPYIDQTQISNYSPSCLIISEWTDANVQTRYKSMPSNCQISNSQFTSFSQAIYFYWASLNNVYQQNLALITSMESSLNSIGLTFNDSVQKIIALSNNIYNYSNALYSLINSYLGVGDQDFYDIVNCCYMKYDLYVFYANLKDNLSVTGMHFCIIFGALSFINLLGQGFLIFFILKNIQEKRKYEMVEEDDKDEGKSSKQVIEMKRVKIQK